jgi:hypothetical protein
MTRRPSNTAVFAGATLAGLAGAFLFARARHSTHRHNLFSTRPTRRFAALGWLEHRADPAVLPLLRDYIAWEPVPVLQGRARRLVRALEALAR